jgi:hypothetical protein
MEAQKFMNLNGLKQCWECDGAFFKHEENAKARAKTSGKDIIPHAINAGVKNETSAANNAVTE